MSGIGSNQDIDITHGKESSHDSADYSRGLACRIAVRFDMRVAVGESRTVDLAALVGQPVDIAPSAYAYRADRTPEQNPPESWILLMQYANLPFNQPVAVSNPALGQVLCGLLWEEVRPVRKVELSWTADQLSRPSPEDLVLVYFDATDSNRAYLVEPSNHQGSGQARGFSGRPHFHLCDPRRYLGRGGQRPRPRASLPFCMSDAACHGAGRVEAAGNRNRVGIRPGNGQA